MGNARVSPGTFEVAPFAHRRDLPCTKAEDLGRHDPWFPIEQNAAAEAEGRRLCHGCPERWPCLDWSIEVRELRHGIFGAHNAAERRAIAIRRGIDISAAAAPLPPVEAERLRMAFRLARSHIDNGIPQKELVGEDVSRTALSEAVAVLAHAADLRDAVEVGALKLKDAAEQARARKKAAA